jgi:xanthine dehydrogenase YagR molybdenum-binding subunit
MMVAYWFKVPVSDSGPGTATAMTQVASQAMGIPSSKISFELGDSSLPPGPTQGGSTTTSTLGAAVYDASMALKNKMAALLKDDPLFHTATIHEVKTDDLSFENDTIFLKSDRSKRITYADLLKRKA